MKVNLWKKTVSVILGLTLIVSMFSNTGSHLSANSFKTISAVWNNTNVTLEYEGDIVPEGAILHVDSVDEQTEANAKQQIQTLTQEEIETTATVVLSLTDAAGNQIQPADNVKVSFDGTDLQNTANVYMNDGTAYNPVEASIVDTNVSFETKTMGAYTFVSLKEASVPQQDVSANEKTVEESTNTDNEKPDFIGNSNMFAGVSEYSLFGIRDLYERGLDRTDYVAALGESDTELSEAKKVYESDNKNIQNVPIKNWKRSISQAEGGAITGDKGKYKFYNWTWNDFSQLNTFTSDAEKVWDGSRNREHNYQEYLSEGMVTAILKGYGPNEKINVYDSATWKNAGNSSIQRFKGNFSLTDIIGFEGVIQDPKKIENIDFTLTQVTDDPNNPDDDRLYINDNIYVFIYPSNKEINENNYLDYLAFWTGTVMQWEDDRPDVFRFNDIKGAKADNLTTAGDGEGLEKLTNRWAMDVVDDNIGGMIKYLYQDTKETEYTIDIVTQDYANGGGTYRYKLNAITPSESETYTFKKVDEKGNPLAGAEFTLVGENGHKYITTSDKDGIVTIIAHGKQTYEMSETKAPEGYQKSENTWKVVLGSNSGDITITKQRTLDEKAVLLPNHDDGYMIENTTKISGDLTFKKIDADTEKELSGAEFTLYSDGNCKNEVKKAVSDSDGVVTFNELLATDYYMKETKAPSGYKLSDKVWTIEAEVNGENVNFTIKDGNTVVEKIENTKKSLAESIDMNKSADLLNWDDRTYTINLDATSTSETVTTTSQSNDIALVLDYSNSMAYDSGQKEYKSLGQYQSLNIKGDKEYYYKEDGKYKKATKRGYFFPKLYYAGTYKELENEEIVYTELSREDVLEQSIEKFIEELATTSPKSNVAVIPFNDNNWYTEQYTKNFRNVSENKDTIISDVKKLSASGGTRPDLGLTKANKLFENNQKNVAEHVILFTDGETDPPRYEDDAETAAQTLKDQNITIHTIAAAESNRDWLDGLATDKDHAHGTEDMADLADIFDDIINSITKGNDISGATIKDYIDPRFEVGYYDNNQWIAYEEGDAISDDGVLKKDKIGYYIEWENQTIKYIKDDNNQQKGWEREFTIRAKQDFLGGNVVPTNGENSGITVANETVYFDKPVTKPTVNVKPLCVLGENREIQKVLGQDLHTWDDVINVLIKSDFRSLLTDEEIDNLKTKGKVSKEYSYGNTNDVLGTITFELDTNDGNFENHKLDKVSAEDNPVETYELKFSYTPISEDNRMEKMNSFSKPNDTFKKENGERYVAETKKCNSTGEVIVKAGSLEIYKTVTEIDKTGGNPIFTFKIEQLGDNDRVTKTLYRTVRFKDTDNNKKLVAEINNLPVGKYRVSELENFVKYVFGGISCDANPNLFKNVVFEIKPNNVNEINLDHTVNGENTFVKKNIQTDKDVVVNRVSKDENGHIKFEQDQLEK